VAKGEETHHKVKYINVNYHPIREHTRPGQTALTWVKSKNNPSDILTKSISADDYIRHRCEISMEPEQDRNNEGEEDQVTVELNVPAEDELET